MKSRLWQNVVSWSVVLICAAGLAVSFNGSIPFLSTTPPPPTVAALVVPPTPVAVIQPQRERLSLTTVYTGMLRPFERYTLCFEIPGQLIGLNARPEQPQLDEGSLVERGQVVARLDDALYQAAKAEAAAHLDMAKADVKRGEDLRAKHANALSDKEWQTWQTEVKLCQARLDRAEKSLRDTTLTAPATGVISKRNVNPGVSVPAHQAVLEILEVDQLLLVVGVPESQIHEIRLQQPAMIDLLSRDAFQRARPPLRGKVYRISESADDKTGLFEVELLVPNADRSLRPGLVARATIVVDEFEGYRLPLASLVRKENQTGFFTIDPSNKAHLVPVAAWAEQDDSLLLPELANAEQPIVVQGQHRLVEGSLVTVTETRLPAQQVELPIRVPATARASLPR